jgi:large subunit ribosomal protein L31
MKLDIQPTLHVVEAHCACGNTFPTRSTNESIRVTQCSNCHPFYTGEKKFIDTAGRIERFERKWNAKKK